MVKLIYNLDPVRTKSLAKRLGLYDDAEIEVKSIIGPPENMKTNRELHSSLIAEGGHSGSMSSHVTDAEHSATNTALLAEMDLSTSVDNISEVAVRGTTQENSNLAVEFSREEFPNNLQTVTVAVEEGSDKRDQGPIQWGSGKNIGVIT